MKIIAAFPYTAVRLTYNAAYNAGYRDGFDCGLEFGEENRPTPSASGRPQAKFVGRIQQLCEP